MKLKVSSKINGEVIFPSVGYPVRGGQNIAITKDQFYNNDIQTGIRKGLLEIDAKELSNLTIDQVEIVNISNKPIGVGPISLLANERKFIDKEMLNDTLVQYAIAANLIKIEQSVSEPKSNVKSKSKKQSKEKKAEKIETKEVETKLQAWDAGEKKLLEKEESRSKVVVDADKTENVEAKVFEEIEKESQPKQKIKRKVSTKKKVNTKKARTIKPVGRVRTSSQTDGDFVFKNHSDDDISFVDEEQENERISQRFGNNLEDIS